MSDRDRTKWWKAEKGMVHSQVLEYVQSVERAQGEMFERFLKLSALYNPNTRNVASAARVGSFDSQVVDNVIASNVDTVFANIAIADVRARFIPDGGDWSAQRRAKQLERYGNGLAKKLGAPAKGRQALKDSSLKGTGPVLVDINPFDEIEVKRVLVDDVIVDEKEMRGDRLPRQMHYREIISEDEAVARYPDSEEEICATTGRAEGGEAERLWAEYRPLERNDVVILHSYYLPLGRKGFKGYRPGRKCITVADHDILDEPWEENFFPIVATIWSQPDRGWYGIGMAERIAGHQRELNKLNWQRDRLRDQFATPTTWVHMADANIAAKSAGRLGVIGAYKRDIPKTVWPQASSPDMERRHAELKQDSSHEVGVSEMASRSAKPAGLDSGAALREYRDATTQRFAQQEKSFEEFQLLIIERILWCAKKLGDKAPEVVRRSKYGPQNIKWSDVDMGEVRVDIQAASSLAKTPAGQTQAALEWAQAGVISMDEARKLSEMPDTDRTISLYTAAQDRIDEMLEDALDGEVIVPNNYMNLKMAVWRGEMFLQQAETNGAPEEILEIIRQFTVQAADLIAMQQQPQQPMADPMAAEPPQMPMPDADPGATLQGAGVEAANLLQ